METLRFLNTGSVQSREIYSLRYNGAPTRLVPSAAPFLSGLLASVRARHSTALGPESSALEVSSSLEKGRGAPVAPSVPPRSQRFPVGGSEPLAAAPLP